MLQARSGKIISAARRVGRMRQSGCAMRVASRFYASVIISFDRRPQVARWADADHDTPDHLRPRGSRPASRRSHTRSVAPRCRQYAVTAPSARRRALRVLRLLIDVVTLGNREGFGERDPVLRAFVRRAILFGPRNGGGGDAAARRARRVPGVSRSEPAARRRGGAVPTTRSSSTGRRRRAAPPWNSMR
jgi:hypothetical protein